MTEHQKGALAIGVVAIAFATMGIFARFLSTDLTLFQQTYLRIGIAAVIAAAVFVRYLSWARVISAPAREWVVVIARAALLYGGVALFTGAVLTTKYANASIVAMVPLMPLFGYLLLSERMTSSKLAYIALGSLGVALVSLETLGTFTWGQGETLALLSAVFFDLSYVARKWHTGHFDNREITVLMLGFGAIMLIGCSVVVGEGAPARSAAGLASIAALVASAAFNVFHVYYSNYGFERISATLAGQLLLIEAPVALMYGLLLYAEAPSALELAGAALILGSAWQMNKIA